MSCVSPCVSSGTEKRSDVNRWSTHVTKVLNSPPARRKFRQYLEDSDEEGYNTLQFWIEIDTIQRMKNNDDLTRNQLLKKYRELISLAEEVNFDEKEMRELKSLVHSRSPVQEDAILRKTKQSAENLLADAHRYFSADLWEKVG